MRHTLSKISQGAVASRIKQKNVFNKRLNCFRLRRCLGFIGSEFHSRGPARSCEASVAEDVGRAARDTGRCVCRSKSTNADVGDELTVLRRCITADLSYSVVLSQDVMQSCAGALLMCLFVHDLTQNLWTDLHEISGRIAVGNSTKLNIDYEHSRGAPGGVCLTPFDLERPSLIGLP